MRVTQIATNRVYAQLFNANRRSPKTTASHFSQSDTLTLSPNALAAVKILPSTSGPSANRQMDSLINLPRYIEDAKAANSKAIADAGSEIKAWNKRSYVDETDVCSQALTDKYEKLLRQAQTHSDPQAYIQEKYFKKNSAHYVWDLTETERQIAASYELQMLNDGKIKSCNMGDSLFRGVSLHAIATSEAAKEFNRQMVNAQLHNLLSENGVELSPDTDLSLVIDPYTYALKVTGTNDDELQARLEQILNSGDNASQLYRHIIMSSGGDCVESTQVTDEGQLKYSLYHETRKVTGLDISQLMEDKGGYYTETGENLLDIFNRVVDKAAENGIYFAPAAYLSVYKTWFADMVHQAATRGWNNVPDMTLSIGYRQGGLQDMFQNHGYGIGAADTDWLTAAMNQSTFNTLP